MRNLRGEPRQYAPREGRRTLLAWRCVGRSAPFHADPSSGWQNAPLGAVRGALMNSEERRAARRKREEERRAKRKAERVKDCTLENVADLNSLYVAARQCGRGVKWKASVQSYLIRILRNITKAHRDLMDGVDICRPTHDFVIFERGVRREISAVAYPERVIKKSYCQNALVPAVVPTLIANNYANVKGRGTHYAIKKMKEQLANHYRKHGAEGYILLVDISSYFASIDHEHAKEILENFEDERLKALGARFIDNQGEVGLGLGDEPNQMHAVAYLSPVDHFVTECCSVEAYGRYMDDLYAIHTDKEHLRLVLACIESICQARGMKLNAKKTKIVKLSRGFCFLKKRFFYTETGKIIVRPERKGITRQRRKLKAMAKLVRDGKMTPEQANQAYQSWRGGMGHLNAQKTTESMDALYKELFTPDESRGGLTEIELPLAA